MTEVLEHPVCREAEPLVTRFKSLAQTARDPKWVGQIRKSAMAYFAETGFPTQRHEEWKFTNIAPLLSLSLDPIQSPARQPTLAEIGPFTFSGLDCHRVVFIDGHYSRELSDLPANSPDIKIGSLRQWMAEGHDVEKHLGQYADLDSNAFTILNTAFFLDGAFISIAAGKTAPRPIHLLFIATTAQPGAAAHPRNLILAARDSSAVILETYVSLSQVPYVTNSVTELVLETGARVEHCKIQAESEQAFHLATIQAHQEKNSHWTSHSISTGARLARNDIRSSLTGEHAECVLNGLYLGRGEQLIDHHTVVDHQSPNCESHEFYNGILDGHSRGVFNGKIFVREDAQKTNARQTNRNLVLSDDAMIDTKPQLEIFADDVKCTHGATVGRLDEDQLFYLRARGIGLEAARRMLIHAFASQVIGRVGMEPVREALDRILMERTV